MKGAICHHDLTLSNRRMKIEDRDSVQTCSVSVLVINYYLVDVFSL